MLSIRKALESDLQQFFDWRNDPMVVAASFTPGKIEMQDHRSWYLQKLASDYCSLYVVEHDSVPAGQVRFDIDGSSATINYSLGSDFRGRGLARDSVSKALAAFQADHADVPTVIAFVKPDNIASCKVFEKLNFEADGFDTTVQANRYHLDLNALLDDRIVEIAGRKIGPGHPPYVIAEISANHNGSLDAALRLIEAAAEAGADAVKIQTYRADTITLDSDKPEFQIKGGLWDGRTLYELYEQAHTPWEWHGDLFAKARDVGITLFSSPFDFTAVDLLEELDSPAFKIASFEAVDLPLIKRVAQTGKPMIISTGMSDEDEIAEAVDTARQAGCEQLVVLHCVSGYPAPASDYNLRTIADIGTQHNVVVGLSDHTLGNATAIAAIALGASVIEKHFTLDREGGGPDDSFSLEPGELADLCRDCHAAWQALGQVDYSRKQSEQGNAQFRRSLYVVTDVKAGDLVSADNVRSVRPGFGLAPRHYEEILGRRFAIDVEKASPVSWELLKDADDESP